MGIKSLFPFLKKTHAEAISTIGVRDLRGKKVFIDCSVLFHKALRGMTFFSSKMKYRPFQPKTESGARTGHIVSLITQLKTMKEVGAEPVFVLDGEPPALKAATVKKRQQLAEASEQRMQQCLHAGDFKEAFKHLKRTVRISQPEIDLAVDTLKKLGGAVVQCEGESDRVLAHFARQPDSFALSEDSDLLPLGARFLARKGAKPRTYELYDLQRITASLGLTPAQFTHFCVLLGTDYSANVPRLRVTTILNELRAGAEPLAIVAKHCANPLIADRIRLALAYFLDASPPNFQLIDAAPVSSEQGLQFVHSVFSPGKIRTSVEKKLSFLQ